MKPIVYGLIAGAVVIALLAAIVLFSGGGEEPSGNDGDTGGTPTGTIDSTSGGDGAALTSDTQVEYEGVSFTVPAGWEEKELDAGVDYTLYGDGYWVDCMVSSVGTSEGFDPDRWLEDKTEWYGYMSGTEVRNAKTTSISGYPTAYMEVVTHREDMADGYEMVICMDTPSGNLVQMSGTCDDDNQEGKDQLHAIADTLAISESSGSSGSSSPATLEEYFDANPGEYAMMETAFQEGFSSSLDSDVSAEATLIITGNDLECRVDIARSFTDEEIAAIQSELENQFDIYTADMQDIIANLEAETGYSPITLTLSYYDQNGTLLGSHTYSG